ncbi:MAG TPA: hypothetical protein VGF24_07865 [Vicinamibacterales bacterium]
MRIVFIARHYSYLRLFESAVEQLAARGHDLVLAADRLETMGGHAMVERLARRYPNVHLADVPGRHAGAWSELARHLRLGLDYLRFLGPRYLTMQHLRRRARDRAPRVIVRLAESGATRWLGGPPRIARWLAWLERGLPVAGELEAFITSHAPAVLLLTPLVDVGSPQLDHFAAARRLGVRTVLPVSSWDHLSSKALLREIPERVIVWNESQRTEAIDMHGVPAGRVVVTGAQPYDQWFDRVPAIGYEAFCTKVGLPPNRPFVLYACSSLFRGTASEPAFVERWIQAVRSSADPRLKDLGILVRPHPARLDEWKQVDLSGYRNVAFWGAHPVDAEAKEDYFDSMYYSAAVVGLNTSAFIEAAVVGKPVHTVLLPEISQDNQEGTLHFHYLLDVNGGLLRVARSLEEHATLLAGSLAAHGGGDAKAARFVEGFVRPFGRNVPATPRFVAAIEAAAALPAPPRERRGLSSMLAYLTLFPIALALSIHLRSQPWRRRTRSRLRKKYEQRKLALLRWVKRFVTDQFIAAGKRRKGAPTLPPSTLTPKAGKQRDPAKALAGTESREAHETRDLVTVLGRSGRPILIGPWLSETGFELLYWIPFLAWAKAYGNLDPDRLVVISRGGAASWYRHITPHYEEIFSFFTPDEFRVNNERRIVEQGGRQKHVEISSFDREILARVEKKRGLTGAEVLHPSQMYQLFDNFWLQRAPVTLVEAFAAFSTIPAPSPSGILATLPERYVAAKFYGNVALPPTPENTAFVSSYLADLVQHVDVVLLNTAQQFDDHADFPPKLRGRLHSIDRLMTPENNLAIQTEVIRGAQGFVGTYGGFSYLAPLCGTNTLAFYSHAGGFRFDHLEVAKRVFSALRCGTFTEVDLRATDVLRLGFGGAMPQVGAQ